VPGLPLLAEHLNLIADPHGFGPAGRREAVDRTVAGNAGGEIGLLAFTAVQGSIRARVRPHRFRHVAMLIVHWSTHGGTEVDYARGDFGI